MITLPSEHLASAVKLAFGVQGLEVDAEIAEIHEACPHQVLTAPSTVRIVERNRLVAVAGRSIW